MSSLDDRRVAGPELVAWARAAVVAVESVLQDAIAAVSTRLRSEERVAGQPMDRAQRATHGLAWLAAYVEAVRQLCAYAERLHAVGALGETEGLLIRLGLAEYLSQVAGGIPMSQCEIVRPADLGLSAQAVAQCIAGPLEALSSHNDEGRAELVARLCRQVPLTVGDCALNETLVSIRQEIAKFTDREIVPQAQAWHLSNNLIPLDVVAQMSALGVFGLTVPEIWGGMGLGKEGMCVVAEEFSRGFLGAGSLATRSEIAAELILANGTEAQKRRWLPKIASGEVLPTAVFTEPDSGSDLASLKTRAIRHGDVYRIHGAKTWITHGARADMMTLLVRTDPKETNHRGDGRHRGLSMLIAPKPRGTDEAPFPVAGMSGTEIDVLGYRGMKEYEIAFDGFEVATENLLGGVEGQGFKQLMATFESARIQTAARAIGVAQAALEHALRYAVERRQFGEPLINFPRVADKIAMMAVEITIARQLTYFAARQKDCGKRCDLQAGMAKLLAARIAWSAADAAVQIHGGNGFALEFPVSRLLCDARVLSIFEGASEIQAQVIAKRLLEN